MKRLNDKNIVYVDLSNKKIVKEEITPEIRKKYIGGIGINTKIIYESEAMFNDALSEKNILIFGVGPAVGTGIMAGNRCTITAKSPITDIYGDSNIGGDFTLRMRAVGVDNLVFTGKSETPVYLFIDKNEEVHILDATDIWGIYTSEVTDILTERHGEGCEVACIGPAGENLNRFASVIMSKNHVAGRMGMGCIMGSKKLKAIIIEKKKQSPLIFYNKDKVNEIKIKWLKKCKKSVIAKIGSLYGSLFLIEANDKGKHFPIRNFKTGHDKQTKKIYPNIFNYEYKTKRQACYACPVGCSKAYEVKEGKYKGEGGARIEFGAAASLGPLVGIFDWPSILHLKLLVDNVGVDTIELGGSIGLIIECQERGILKKEDVDGRVLQFGNIDDIKYLIDKMVKREGIGDLIAEGSYRIGKALNAEEYAFCINKSSTGLQNRNRLVRSLGYITSTRGGDHLKSFAFTMQNGGFYIAKHIFKIKKAQKQLHTTERKGRVLWWHENYKNIVDALGVCLFAIQGLPGMGVGMFDDFADIMNAFYNLDMTEKDVFNVGERIYQLQNAFNVNCGLELNDYQWPIRKDDGDIEANYIKNTTIEVRDAPGMLPEYFQYRGLTKEGRPTVERFKDLDIYEYIERANAVYYKDTSKLDELLQEISLNIKFTLADRIKIALSSVMLIKLLDLKDKIETKKYLKEKKKV